MQPFNLSRIFFSFKVVLDEARVRKDLDVVWRRVENGSPTYVFEVQVKGDLYHAIDKLKHVHDLWNSNIFLIVAKEDVEKAKELLAGTFHEVQSEIKIIETDEVYELYKLKKAYRDYERKLGIL